uniref:Uncharacterized protein n=1 Tax=Knipowitschia caucasica TaxID=637954 RepID=A0AAV2KU28_KNICA
MPDSQSATRRVSIISVPHRCRFQQGAVATLVANRCEARAVRTPPLDASSQSETVIDDADEVHAVMSISSSPEPN